MKKSIRNLIDACDRKVTSQKEIEGEVKAIGNGYNLFQDLAILNSKQVFDEVVTGDDFLLMDFPQLKVVPNYFIYITEVGTMYYVDLQGYRYMRYIAKIKH